MEKNRRHLTERILDLTLEIIYLLTGEECIITKKTSSDRIMSNSIIRVSQRCSRKQRPKMELPIRSLISELNNDKKILEVTRKIIELLTGEVPIRCQDVSVYLSMEEWKYLEGHKDLYKDAMMEDRPPLPSPEGSANTPQRCPHPLDSRESTLEHHRIPQDDQDDCVSDVKATEIEEKMCIVVQRKERRLPTVGIIRKNAQQRCLNPRNFRSSAQERHKASYGYRREHQLSVKAKGAKRAEDKFLRNDLKDRECQSNTKAKDTERVESKLLRVDTQKERECQLDSKAKDLDRAEDECLRIDLYKERECQLNLKEKEENNVLRTDGQKVKHVEAEFTKRVEDKFLRTETERNEHHHERQVNYKAELEKKNEREFPFQRFSNRNTPRRCSSPLYHWDSRGEHRKVLRDNKGERLLNIKVEVMENDDETYLWRDMMCKEDDVSTDESNNRNTPERCQSPLYSWDSTLENHKILSNYQEERSTSCQAGGRRAPEKMYRRGVEQCEEEEIPPEIGTDGRYTEHNMDKCPMIFPDGEMEDDATGDSLEETPIDPNLYRMDHSMGQSSGLSTHGGSFHDHVPPAAHRTYRRRGETFMCSECGECFTAKAKLFKHQRDHIVDKPHSCPDCGKCFVEKSHLVNHQRSHSVEKPYSCSICGKCFGEKGHLANHEKSHTNEKEFFCYECGKCFTQRGHFNRHQRLHTGEKPYPCPECGKCFPHREYLIRHLRVHAGQKPFPCSECGKCFTDKYDLAKHERIHSGHRPYSCPECGRGFTQKSNLARHVRVHADYHRIHVLTVGNGSPGEPPSSTISVPTGDERFLYQDMTAE